nr:hypothetical protein Iba_chr10fCG5430 [Ipomoea batatas]
MREIETQLRAELRLAADGLRCSELVAVNIVVASNRRITVAVLAASQQRIHCAGSSFAVFAEAEVAAITVAEPSPPGSREEIAVAAESFRRTFAAVTAVAVRARHHRSRQSPLDRLLVRANSSSDDQGGADEEPGGAWYGRVACREQSEVEVKLPYSLLHFPRQSHVGREETLHAARLAILGGTTNSRYPLDIYPWCSATRVLPVSANQLCKCHLANHPTKAMTSRDKANLETFNQSGTKQLCTVVDTDTDIFSGLPGGCLRITVHAHLTSAKMAFIDRLPIEISGLLGISLLGIEGLSCAVTWEGRTRFFGRLSLTHKT